MLVSIKSDRSWLTELKRRRAAIWAEPLSASLHVAPGTSAWWYIQEFGSATRGEMVATGTANRDASGRYEIVPLRPGGALVFEGGDGPVVADRVWHPGVYPQAFVRSALQFIKEHFAAEVGPLVALGQMHLAREVLLGEVMGYALHMIVLNIEQTLRGTRADGRLHNQSAADNFEAGATIVDNTN